MSPLTQGLNYRSAYDIFSGRGVVLGSIQHYVCLIETRHSDRYETARYVAAAAPQSGHRLLAQLPISSCGLRLARNLCGICSTS